MKHSLMSDAILNVLPEAQFTISDGDTETIIFHDSNTLPTDVELNNSITSVTIMQAWERLRRDRDQFLNDTDWWVLRGSITEEQTAYRQTLRDLPANTPDPANPTWPVGPGD